MLLITIKSYQIKPNYYEALNGMGLALTELKKYSEAKNILKQAIKIKATLSC